MRKLLMLLPLSSIPVSAWSQSLVIGGVNVSLNEKEDTARAALTGHGMSLEDDAPSSNSSDAGDAFTVKRGTEEIGTIYFNSKGKLVEINEDLDIGSDDSISSGLLFESLVSLLDGKTNALCQVSADNSVPAATGDPGTLRSAKLECDSTSYTHSLFMLISGAKGSKIPPGASLVESIEIRGGSSRTKD